MIPSTPASLGNNLSLILTFGGIFLSTHMLLNFSNKKRLKKAFVKKTKSSPLFFTLGSISVLSFKSENSLS